jgi:hypothetical protein
VGFRDRAAGIAGLAAGGLPIPERGLDEVLGSWSGQGQLWDALAACAEPIAERRWSADDVRSRAHRVLFSKLEPEIARWPSDCWRWIEGIPPAVVRERIESGAPVPGVDWVATRRRGWPPERFVGRPPRRRQDELLTSILRWTLAELSVVYADAVPAVTVEGELAAERCELALTLLDHPALADAEPLRPGSGDLRALVADGEPWVGLSRVASELLPLDDVSLQRLAWEVVAPDPELAWRLFHLAVLGEVLHALRTSGAQVTSLGPLGAARPGPAFAVVDSEGESWDLWFEAAGAWRYYGGVEPYPEVVAGVPGAGSALGCDVMLVQADRRALLLECKFSARPGVVARDGYLQALAYAVEANELCPAVTAVVVGPAGVVKSPGWADTLPGLIGMVSPDDLPAVVEHALRGE